MHKGLERLIQKYRIDLRNILLLHKNEVIRDLSVKTVPHRGHREKILCSSSVFSVPL